MCLSCSSILILYDLALTCMLWVDETYSAALLLYCDVFDSASRVILVLPTYQLHLMIQFIRRRINSNSCLVGRPHEGKPRNVPPPERSKSKATGGSGEYRHPSHQKMGRRKQWNICSTQSWFLIWIYRLGFTIFWLRWQVASYGS